MTKVNSEDHTGESANKQRIDAAMEKLESHPHFHCHTQTIHVETDGDRLVLTGQLPSYYLKQLAQTALHDLHCEIDNRIHVLSVEGFMEDDS